MVSVVELILFQFVTIRIKNSSYNRIGDLDNLYYWR